MTRTLLLLPLLIVVTAPGTALSQSLGTFRWRTEPYCNVLTVTVVQSGGVFTLDGYDEQCGGNLRLPVDGTAVMQADGSVTLGLSVVTSPGAPTPVNLEAVISPATASGTWRDSAGNSGAFTFNPTGTSGGPRPGAVPGRSIPSAFLLQPDGGFLARGEPGQGSIPASGTGTRMMWHPGKAAFRAGHLTVPAWDEGNIGFNSVAFGHDTVASGDGSAAFGRETQATGFQSAAFGFQSRASGYSSFAAGVQTEAAGETSAAFGDGARALGHRSFAAGSRTTATGVGAVAMGDNARAEGRNSIAIGSAVVADVGAHGAVVLGSHAIAGNLGDGNPAHVASGTFIFGDRSTTNDLLSLGANEFLMRVAGGVRIFTSANLGSGVTVAPGGGSWASLSDAHAKEHFRELDGGEVLAKLARLPIREWNYKTQDAAIRHVGPTAQDFRAAFGLGEDDTRINTVDADGIALRAIQALEARSRALSEENTSLRLALDELTRALDDHRAAMRSEVDALRGMLAAAGSADRAPR